MAIPIMEGWMVRYGRRKIGRSFFHKRYFVLEPVMLAYYKRKPSDKEVPLKSLLIDGNCRVQDRGLETHHGHAVYVLSIYNMKDKSHRITMAALNIQEACAWKEALEQVIDQHLGGHVHIQPSLQQFDSLSLKVNERERTASSSDRESLGLTAQEEEEKQGHLCGNGCVAGLPDSVQDWTSAVEPYRETEKDPLISRKHMRLVRCQNGLRFFEEIPDVSRGAQSPYRAMMAVGVVEASCSDIFELIMGMDETRYEWDCSFHFGSLVEEVDGHTAVLYHRLQIEWFPMLVWPRDLCYTRYWRRNDDGSYVILFRSREHANCLPQPGCVRAHMESGGFTISPLQSRSGSTEPRARVQHLVEFDLKGWGVGRVPFFQQHTMIQMLNSVAGLREWFSQRDGSQPTTVQRMGKIVPELVSVKKPRKRHVQASPSIAQAQAARLEESLQDDDSDDEAEEFVVQDKELVPRKLFKEISSPARGIVEEDLSQPLDISAFPGSLKQGHLEIGKNCWSIPHCNNFRVRSKRFLVDRSKVPAGEPQMQLVAVDWFKDTKRMDNLAKRKDCAAQVAADRGFFTIAFNIQVPGSMHYSMVFYFVAKRPLVQGSLLQRFVDGDDSFRNSRLKLIPFVPKGSWIVRQSVGSTPCILGKAVDCTYIRGPKYLEVDADIGSSTVANGVLSLVFGVVTSLVVDMAFLVQGNGMDELPERLIGAVRISHLELGAAISPAQHESPGSC